MLGGFSAGRLAGAAGGVGYAGCAPLTHIHTSRHMFAATQSFNFACAAARAPQFPSDSRSTKSWATNVGTAGGSVVQNDDRVYETPTRPAAINADIQLGVLANLATRAAVDISTASPKPGFAVLAPPPAQRAVID
jgi:hypothetical protein